MQGLMGLTQKIHEFSCLIDFSDSESYTGTSFLPFLGFMVFLIGLVLLFIGIVKINDSKKQWFLFFDNRDKKDFKKPEYVKERKVGIVMVIIGVIMLIASFFIH